VGTLTVMAISTLQTMLGWMRSTTTKRAEVASAFTVSRTGFSRYLSKSKWAEMQRILLLLLKIINALRLLLERQ
jgi:hypothetical protein